MTEEANLAGDLREKFHLLKTEVDALQIEVMSERAPWYKNASILIAVLALLFSFGTTYVSYTRTQNQDIQASRAELRALIQRLASMPHDNVEISKKYSDDLLAIAQLQGFLMQEVLLLGRQGEEILRNLPPEYISATEYYSVALALQWAGNYDGAKRLYTMAAGSSRDLLDRLAALRQIAQVLFQDGEPEEGRVEYQKALNIFSDYPRFSEYTKKVYHIDTELHWAYAEANTGLFEEAMQHIVNAEKIVASLQEGPGTDAVKNRIAQQRILFASGVKLQPPSSGLPDGGRPSLSGSP